MLNNKVLLTSFQTWLPHQKSNASDDLLEMFQQEFVGNAALFWLRKLPVNTPQASILTINKIEDIRPQVVICCGMAESRSQLTIESRASCGEKLLSTAVDLEGLITKLVHTEISHEAGKFVCEGLYYNVLHHLKRRQFNSSAIFVHVPLLNEENASQIKEDFRLILQSFL
ncbi:MAG: peptidase C15 [Spirulinaceae cyanobacterium]